MTTTLCFLGDPLPTTPGPCGVGLPEGVSAWQSAGGRCPGEPVSGEGVCFAPAACPALAGALWTLECWLTWPGGVVPLRGPAVLAEAAGPGWSWTWGFDHVGAMTLVGRNGDAVKVVAGDILIDAVRAGRWYHAAVALNGDGECRLYFTEEGNALARPTGARQKLDAPARPGSPQAGPAPDGPATLALGCAASPAAAAAPGPWAAVKVGDGVKIGEGVQLPAQGDRNMPSAVHIGSAALHARFCGPEDFPALGGAPLPKGLAIDGDLEYGNLGRVFALAKDAVVFTPGPKEAMWFAFRARARRGRTVRFLSFKSVSVHVSEDGGRTWRPPNGGTWRSFDERCMVFTHTFGAPEAIFATSPPVTAAMAQTWVHEAAARFGGRVRTVGASRLGRPLEVVEVGNPDAPLVYLQAGQHSMEERMGFFTVTAALEAAAQDAELMAATRWAIMPLVNVDSYCVGPPDGNMNRFWGKDNPPPTIAALVRFLREETERTGGIVMGDWHSGPVFRGVTLLSQTTRGFSDPAGNWNSLHLRRESAYPELEACLWEAGLRFTVLNGYERNRATHGKMGMFEDYTVHLRGVKDPLCVELSPIVIETEGGAVPVSIEALRADGARWAAAIKRFIAL